MSPVSRIVSKTTRSPLCSENVWFLVKIPAEDFDKNKLQKTRVVSKKNAGLKKTKFGYSAIFSNLSILRSETQLTSDKMSKARI